MPMLDADFEGLANCDHFAGLRRRALMSFEYISIIPRSISVFLGSNIPDGWRLDDPLICEACGRGMFGLIKSLSADARSRVRDRSFIELRNKCPAPFLWVQKMGTHPKLTDCLCCIETCSLPGGGGGGGPGPDPGAQPFGFCEFILCYSIVN